MEGERQARPKRAISTVLEYAPSRGKRQAIVAARGLRGRKYTSNINVLLATSAPYIVMAGLVPAIHVVTQRSTVKVIATAPRGWPGQARP
jgi:hypothetical protein